LGKGRGSEQRTGGQQQIFMYAAGCVFRTFNGLTSI
jgi:hypothetical protein